MKEVLGKFDPVEVFAYLSPGALLLFSLLLWGSPPETDTGWRGFVLGALFFLAAYAAGVMLAAWASEGAAIHARRPRASQTVAWGWGKWLLYQLFFLPVRFFHGMPQPMAGNPAATAAQLDMVEQLRLRIGFIGLTQIFRTPWGLLELFRSVAADLVGEKGKSVIDEAEATHRRFRFGLGVALVLGLIATQCIARLLLPIVWVGELPWIGGLPSLPPVPRGALVFLGIASLVGSFGLRWVAARWWETEFALTCVLLRAIPADAPPAPAKPEPPACTVTVHVSGGVVQREGD